MRTKTAVYLLAGASVLAVAVMVLGIVTKGEWPNWLSGSITGVGVAGLVSLWFWFSDIWFDPTVERIYQARDRKRQRSKHNDRDYNCRHWWGDRGGYNHLLERCTICNPKPEPRDDGFTDWDSGEDMDSLARYILNTIRENRNRR